MRDFSRAVVEWPTLAVAGAIYAGYGLLTFYYHILPWWLVLPAGGYLLAWHGSLQHEVVHDHPTPWRWLNRALVFPSLWLWMPMEVYADTHLRHHHDESITDPVEDPESYYLSRKAWARTGGASPQPAPLSQHGRRAATDRAHCVGVAPHESGDKSLSVRRFS